MQEVYEFLKQAGTYYLATVEGDQPRVRPFGTALIFPVLTLRILDMYPRQRGSASSMQAFSVLVTNTLVAGVLSPLLSHHGLHLALGAAAFIAAAGLLWWLELRAITRSGKRAPDQGQ